jgi:hypothetical protein
LRIRGAIFESGWRFQQAIFIWVAFHLRAGWSQKLKRMKITRLRVA